MTAMYKTGSTESVLESNRSFFHCKQSMELHRNNSRFPRQKLYLL